MCLNIVHQTQAPRIVLTRRQYNVITYNNDTSAPAQCLRLLGVFLRTLHCPTKNATQYWKPCHIKGIHETTADESSVLLTIVRKSCTTNEADVLDADADQII